MSIFHLTFGTITYAIFWGVFSYLIIFMGGDFIGVYVPSLEALELKTINSGTSIGAIPGVPPLMHNIILLIVFGFQHSLMARLGFKNIVTKYIPKESERSFYVLTTCGYLIWLYLSWYPLSDDIWHLDGLFHGLITALFLGGALVALWSTFLINHFQLFGISQAWHAFKGTQPLADCFQEKALYKYSRHPLYLGMLTTFWFVPTMTTGHLLFSAIWTAYIFIGIGYEERDLMHSLGDKYREYMMRVPQLIPLGRRK
ncbi:DUF1295 domain-containing protein [Temperatibacter marinus]|uniref:DUF1295 domain-containing protein n=1 Tax=Temperatibacter marinus TaxID=1456591 RepID=A0AA52EFC7_9PROT|nr:DUF1295 domain-containing protein [Temperatibacter marinus]WND01810.1 DUF1295 domain-containing protein [Temperatibacter marinus]